MNYLSHIWHATTAAMTAFVLWAVVRGGLLEAVFLICLMLVIEGYLEYTREN